MVMASSRNVYKQQGGCVVLLTVPVEALDVARWHASC